MVVLRVRAPAESAGIEVLRGNQGSQITPELVDQADLVVIQRDFPRFWTGYQEVFTRAREKQKPVIYEIDDLLLEMPEDHSHRQDYQGETIAMLTVILEADAITTSSVGMYEYLRDLNPNVYLLPNFLPDSLWYTRPVAGMVNQDDKVVIGYMGGETHQADLQLLVSVLLSVHQRYLEKVIFRFWGVKPPDELRNLPCTEWIEINELDYQKFTQFFLSQQCDIFLAPLRDNLFNRKKSSIKYLEYSILGIPGIYSRLEPYEKIVNPDVTGYMATNESEWLEHLIALIENLNLRHEMGKACQQVVRRNWMLSQHAHEWTEAYQSVVELINKDINPPGAAPTLVRLLRLSETYQSNLEDQLYATSNQLHDIHSSQSWRLIQRLNAMRQKVKIVSGSKSPSKGNESESEE